MYKKDVLVDLALIKMITCLLILMVTTVNCNTFDLNLNRVFNILGIDKPDEPKMTQTGVDKLVKLFDDGGQKTQSALEVKF